MCFWLLSWTVLSEKIAGWPASLFQYGYGYGSNLCKMDIFHRSHNFPKNHPGPWLICLKLVVSLWCIVDKTILVGGFNPSEKYESQLGLLFPIYGKKHMFQTTNQYKIVIIGFINQRSHHWGGPSARISRSISFWVSLVFGRRIRKKHLPKSECWWM